MKIAVVTGAAIRIGQGIALELLQKGFSVILHANTNFEALKQWVSNSPYASQVLALIKADFANEEGQKSFCQLVHEKVSSIDLLVHNASYYVREPFLKITRDEYRRMQMVNAEAPYFLTQSLVELLKRSQLRCVINIADAVWERPHPGFSHYFVSKAGLAILTRALATELAPDIRVNAIAPGSILFQDFYSENAKLNIINRIPFRRQGAIVDIASMVSSIAENAPYVTGQIINVDGGRSIAS